MCSLPAPPAFSLHFPLGAVVSSLLLLDHGTAALAPPASQQRKGKALMRTSVSEARVVPSSLNHEGLTGFSSGEGEAGKVLSLAADPPACDSCGCHSVQALRTFANTRGVEHDWRVRAGSVGRGARSRGAAPFGARFTQVFCHFLQLRAVVCEC